MANWKFDGYSNFDHTWDDGAKEEVDSGGTVTHSALNFNGKIRLDYDGGYIEEVYRFGSVVDEVRAEDLDVLVKKVNDKWGWD